MSLLEGNRARLLRGKNGLFLGLFVSAFADRGKLKRLLPVGLIKFLTEKLGFNFSTTGRDRIYSFEFFFKFVVLDLDFAFIRVSDSLLNLGILKLLAALLTLVLLPFLALIYTTGYSYFY